MNYCYLEACYIKLDYLVRYIYWWAKVWILTPLPAAMKKSPWVYLKF